MYVSRGRGKPDSLTLESRFADGRRSHVGGRRRRRLTTSPKRARERKKGNDVGSSEAKSILTAGNQYFTFLGSFFAAVAVFSAFFQPVFPKWQH